MREKSKLETLLEKIHINLYDYNGKYEELEIRSFEDVASDLAKSWEALNDDFKDELYGAMGIIPSKPKSNLGYPVGIRGEIKCPSDTINPMKIAYAKDTGIEYIQNQPTTCGLNEIKEIYKDTLEMTRDADSKKDLIRFNAKAIVDDIYYENAKFEICCDGGIVLENYKEM